MKLSHRLSVSLLVFLCTAGVHADTTRPDAEKKLAFDIYKEFIEIPSGFTTGASTPVIEAAAARLKAAGFADIDMFTGGVSPHKSNLVVRYRGTGKQKPLLLLAHVDVVEAKPEDWSTDPFKLIERDGYYYGRGTIDDKAQAAVWIANLIQYKREGFKPDRDIIVALTTDEEGGGPYNGVEWLLKHHRHLIEADVALNEGGWGDSEDGRNIANHIQVSEKYIVNYRFEVKNKGGHSSLPVADNAIYHLAGALTNVSKLQFPMQTNAVTAAYFTALAKTETGPLRRELAAVATNSPTALAHVAAASPAWNATLRTTCVPTLLEAGHAKNALPQLAAANINCRILPEDNESDIKKALLNIVNDKAVSITAADVFLKTPMSPMRADVMKAVTESTHAIWPGLPVIPVMVMGATDGRYLRAAGIPTYGVQGFFIDRNDMRAHGRDERMRVKAFYEGQAFLYDLVKRMSSSV